MSGEGAAGKAVSRETAERLEAFAGLVRKWSPRINLVAPRDLNDLERRHIADSVQLFDHLPPQARSWIDLGSGGGFPGLVIAILAAERAPDLAVTLVDADQRKAAFLRTALRELGLVATVLAARIEEVAPAGADVVSARALMSLDRLLGPVARHLAPGGLALLPKGRTHADEIDRARQLWSFDLQIIPSATDPDARLLRIERIVRA